MGKGICMQVKDKKEEEEKVKLGASGPCCQVKGKSIGQMSIKEEDNK